MANKQTRKSGEKKNKSRWNYLCRKLLIYFPLCCDIPEVFFTYEHQCCYYLHSSSICHLHNGFPRQWYSPTKGFIISSSSCTVFKFNQLQHPSTGERRKEQKVVASIAGFRDYKLSLMNTKASFIVLLLLLLHQLLLDKPLYQGVYYYSFSTN